jgi:hypothetical protein
LIVAFNNSFIDGSRRFLFHSASNIKGLIQIKRQAEALKVNAEVNNRIAANYVKLPELVAQRG